MKALLYRLTLLAGTYIGVVFRYPSNISPPIGGFSASIVTDCNEEQPANT